MNDLHFSFGPSPWELTVDKLSPGESLSAIRALTLLEEEGEQAAQEALEELTNRGISLDLTGLPVTGGSAETAERLKKEARLVKENRLPEGLAAEDPLRLYLEEVARTPAAGEQNMLAHRAAAGETAAAEMLVNVSLSLVIQEAKNHAGQGVLLLDLIQEGSLGLWQSIFCWQGSGDFVDHSRWYIRQAMARAITLQAQANGVGTKLKQLLESYRAADRLLLSKLGRNPVLEEIALQMNVPVEDALAARQMLEAAQLLEQARKATQPREQTPEDDMAVEDTAYFQSRQRILDMLSGLDETDAAILSMRFGLDGKPPMEPQAVADRLNLPLQQVQQREAAALAALRNKKD